MNMRSISILLLGTSLMLGAQVTKADNVPVNRKISHISTYGTWAAIQYSPAYTNDVGCPGSVDDRVAVINWGTNSNNKAMYAMAMSAFLTNKTVGFGILGCWSSYGGGVPLVYRVDVKD